MAINHICGNIFTSKAQTIVNTVNCEGVMGAGIALECRLRYPLMFQRYLQLCSEGLLSPGKLWIWRSDQRWVLNFPTKTSWKQPSRMEYLEAGLEKLVTTWQQQGIQSLAFPLLGADRGALPPDHVVALMEQKLAPLANFIDIEIYHYDAKSTDDLYQQFAAQLLSTDQNKITQATGIKSDKLAKLEAAVRAGKICQLNQLVGIDGIGEKTLEKLFLYCQAPFHEDNHQQPEFEW